MRKIKELGYNRFDFQQLTDRKGYVQIPNFVVDILPMGPLAIYCMIKRRAGETGICTMAKRTICKSLHVNHKTANIAIDFLEKSNLITKAGQTKAWGKPIQNWRVVDVWAENKKWMEKRRISKS